MYIALEVILSFLGIGIFYFFCGWLDASQMIAKDWSSVLDLWSTPKIVGLMLIGPLFMWYGARNLFKYTGGQFWLSIIVLITFINICNLIGRSMASPGLPSKGEIVGLIMMLMGIVISSVWK